MIKYLLLIIFLLFCSYYDFKTKKVPKELLWMGLLVAGFINPTNIILGVMIFVLGYVIYIAEIWGGADVYVLSSIALYFTMVQMLVFLILMCLMILLMYKPLQKYYMSKFVPLIPAMTLSVLSLIFLIA